MNNEGSYLWEQLRHVWVYSGWCFSLFGLIDFRSRIEWNAHEFECDECGESAQIGTIRNESFTNIPNCWVSRITSIVCTIGFRPNQLQGASSIELSLTCWGCNTLPNGFHKDVGLMKCLSILFSVAVESWERLICCECIRSSMVELGVFVLCKFLCCFNHFLSRIP